MHHQSEDPLAVHARLNSSANGPSELFLNALVGRLCWSVDLQRFKLDSNIETHTFLSLYWKHLCACRSYCVSVFRATLCPSLLLSCSNCGSGVATGNNGNSGQSIS